MRKANYSWCITGKFICITDLGGICPSVTNMAESVINEIDKQLLLLDSSIEDYRVIYMNSDGQVDGLRTKNCEFAGFVDLGATTFIEGMAELNNYSPI